VAREDGLRSTVVTLLGVLALVGVGIGAAFALRSSPPAPLATTLSASVVFPGSAANAYGAQTCTEGAANADGGPQLQTWTVGSGPAASVDGAPNMNGGARPAASVDGAPSMNGGARPAANADGLQTWTVGSGSQAPSLDSGAAASVDGGPRPNADGLIYAREYRHWLYEPNTGISFFWQNDATTLYVGLISPGTGWVSVGLGGHGDRAGTSTVIGCVRNGKVVLEDRYGALGSQRRRDREPRFLAAGGTELCGETTLEFAIPLASGDREIADLVPGGTIGVTLARHGTKDDFTVEQACCGTTWIPLD
jgi:hypothetical protein